MSIAMFADWAFCDTEKKSRKIENEILLKHGVQVGQSWVKYVSVHLTMANLFIIR